VVAATSSAAIELQPDSPLTPNYKADGGGSWTARNVNGPAKEDELNALSMLR